MREDLDTELCKKYPKIFADRYKSMRETCMCWGFECGDGWYNILNTACGMIQSHIDWSRKQRLSNLRFNRALKKALSGNKEPLTKYYSFNGVVDGYVLERVEEAITKAAFRNVVEAVPQVVADQVKEKFGTLRFYVHGGDEYTNGIVAMAEAMSANMCETCGKPGKLRGRGWIYTACDEHSRDEPEDDEDE